MPEQTQLVRAQLREVRLADDQRPTELAEPRMDVTVQFNPETLKVSYSNSFEGGGEGGAALQFVTKSTTKLSVELWFDATTLPGVQDVRTLTGKVNHFMRRKKDQREEQKWAPPGVRLHWGSFLFDGVMESMEETLEFFSPEGRPLRARVAIALSNQEIPEDLRDPATPSGAPGVGTEPQAAVTEGDTLQDVVGRSGDPRDWRPVAERAGIENPRRPEAGTRVPIR